MAEPKRVGRPVRLVFDAAVITLFVALAALPWDQWVDSRVALGETLAAPSFAHPLGTDNLGRDLLVRVSQAVRGGVLPLWFGVGLGSLAGLVAAITAISLGQRREARPLVALFDLAAVLLASVPVGLAAFGWAVVNERAGLAPVLLTLGALFAVRAYLETRDLFRHDSALAFWTAHAALGGRLLARLWRYGVLAGWRWSLLQSLGFHLRAAVAIEASLSYLGFGVQEPQASFGNMLASHFDLYLKGQPGILAVLLALLALTAAAPAAAVNVGMSLDKLRRAPER